MKNSFFAWVRLCLCILALISRGSLAQTRHALVIGNDSYPGNALQNARNDAKGVFEALQAKGYASTLVLDADRSTLSKQIDSFVDGIRPGDVAFLYYAGHGMQIDGENLLVPTDFHLTTEGSAKDQAYALSAILERFSGHGATTQVVILDACRDNPFLGSRSSKGGWAGTGTSAGAFLAFGTSPGSTASDDPAGTHGLFTKYLLKEIGSSDLDIEEMFRKVREGVIRDSGGKQVPWVSSSLIGSFHVDPDSDADAKVLAPYRDETSDTDALKRSFEPSSGPPALQTAASERAQLEKAAVLARGAHWDQAIQVVKGIVSLDPRSAIALRLLGLLLHATGRDVQAVEVLNRSVAISGNDPRAAAYKCAIEGLSGTQTAVSDCAAAVRAQPSSDGYLAYAATMASQGDAEHAYATASEALSLRSDDPLAYALRGLLASKQGRSGAAERDFNRAIESSLPAEE